MPKFIKIEDATGGGEQILRTKLILSICDLAEGGSVIMYDYPSERGIIKTRSTAAEVLAAMEGKQRGACPVRFAVHYTNGGTHKLEEAEVSHHDPRGLYYSGSPVSLDDYKRLMGVETFPPFLGLEQEINSASPVGATKDFACTCVHFSGEQDDCPAHGIGTAWRDLHGA